MVEIKIPSYVINKQDNVEVRDSMYGVISVKPGSSVIKELKEAEVAAPNTFSQIFRNDGNLNPNVILAYNGDLLKKENAKATITKDHDEIEILIQFAGG